MIKKVTIIVVFLSLLFTLGSFAVSPAVAQGPGQISVHNSSIQESYPKSLTFSCQVQSNTDITDIRLDYQVQQMSFAQVTSETEISFSPSNSVNALNL